MTHVARQVKELPAYLRGRRRPPAKAAGTTRSFCWDTGDARTWRTILTVRFEHAGLDIDAGGYLPNRYEAVLSNSRLPATDDGSAAEMMPFDLTVAQTPVAAPTIRSIDDFATAALTCLRSRYVAGDPNVCSYFAGPLSAKRIT
ncbi:MAG TPA: hypothetical protein VGL78_04260 [Solirubrobacteraceae bacterium]|jgi:hypothetical protein